MQVKTTPIEAKTSYFANVKSNNYLQNALAVMDAESDECDQVCALPAQSVGPPCATVHRLHMVCCSFASLQSTA